MGNIQFKNRISELRDLNKVLESNKHELIIIYGRRRVGKTEILLKATENKKRIYYLAVARNNLERFYALCSNQFEDIRKLKMDWEILFDFLKDRTDAVIIDEFQNMIEEDDNVLNIFQSIVDQNLKKTNLKLFLAGSSISIITSKLLDYKSPLYGRRTGSMELGNIDFYSLRLFFPKADFEELAQIFGFADGIPYYLNKIETPFFDWLNNELKSHLSFIKDEIDFLMRYEFKDPGTYKLIIEAIANGKNKLGEIKDYLRLQRTDISPYLRNLIDVKMIKRIVPVTENIKSRHGRYKINDNFLNFWFRYIYPNLSLIEEKTFTADHIKNNYNQYLGFVFEDICKKYLFKKNNLEYARIGSWWHKDKEIDIVALNEDKKEILFAECKWQEKVDANKILFDLKEKSKFVEWHNDKRKETFAIFAKSFKNKKVGGVQLYDLKYLEKIFTS